MRTLGALMGVGESGHRGTVIRILVPSAGVYTYECIVSEGSMYLRCTGDRRLPSLDSETAAPAADCDSSCNCQHRACHTPRSASDVALPLVRTSSFSYALVLSTRAVRAGLGRRADLFYILGLSSPQLTISPLVDRAHQSAPGRPLQRPKP
ncbi:hypothetical protein K466DRAFT_143202 [Polyporus arcularius HHB13444]|uniref:Uncharacterized protein n=1 Tax=Polyporus arcularius HHB13444 TaxID=1314778 RepID=A0A5C3PEN9_9APHY|nr:hypothetical protein K466DRAFT_143202 [Polyporus arcularius HHB13444]